MKITVNDIVNSLETAVMHNGCGENEVVGVDFVKTEHGVTCHFKLDDNSVIKVKHKKVKHNKQGE